MSDFHYYSHMDHMKTMSITWWGLLPGLPQPSSENGSLNSTKDENGQGQVPGPKRLCALSHVQSTLVRASDDSSSIAGSLQGHPGCPKWGQIQHFLFTLSSLFSPHLIIGTRPWPAAIPMPMKGWPHCTRSRIQKQYPLPAPSSSWIGLQHQGLSLFPPVELAQAEHTLPFRIRSFSWGPDTLLAIPREMDPAIPAIL